MAHLSLYRRFRPDSFDKIVRQEHVVRVLKNQIQSGSVGHAYLFCGPRGTGKTSVARIFARAVNCDAPVNGSPCGICPTCLSLQKGSLDVSEIDAASNNGVAEMRDLREKVQYPPVSGKYKVYIIDEVHMLTDSAFNALLKTLEEPPAHAIFILATTEPHKIPATILSRCMRLDFKLIPEEDLEKHLISILDGFGKKYEREAVSAIARAGAGSDRDMLSIAEICLAYSEMLTYEDVTSVLGAADFRETSALCEALLHADLSATLEQAEKILQEGKSVGVLCRDLLEMLNRIAIAKVSRSAEKLLALPKTHFQRIAEIAENAEGNAILRATEILIRTETDLRLVSSPRICLETALIKIAAPSADESAEALSVRLGLLEKQLKEGSFLQVSEKQDGLPAKKDRAQDSEAPYEFPLEEPIFEETIFSDPIPVSEKKTEAPPERDKALVREEKKSAGVAAVKAEPEGILMQGQNAEFVYGKFMRLLRKTSRNGVLFTMCSDLEAFFEEDKFVLVTVNGAVFRALMREEHKKVIEQVFSDLGITQFDIRLKDSDDEKSVVEQLKRDFKDYPIEIK